MKKLLLATALIALPLTGAIGMHGGRQITVTLDPYVPHGYAHNNLYIVLKKKSKEFLEQAIDMGFGHSATFQVPHKWDKFELMAACMGGGKNLKSNFPLSEHNDYILKLKAYKPSVYNPGDATNSQWCEFEWSSH